MFHKHQILFFKILQFGQNRYGIDKPCLKAKHYDNVMLLFKRKFFFLFLIYIIYLTNFLNLWILNITFLTADFKTVTKCQYRNVMVLTVMVLMYFQ